MTRSMPFMTASNHAWKTVLFGATALCVVVAGILYGRWLRQYSTVNWAPSAGVATDVVATGAPPRVDRGEVVFQVHCAKCHGPDGHGEPESVQRLRPPPRDFAIRPWRFTVSLDSIRRVTLDGIPATAMPAHRAALASSDLEAVVMHTYRLANSGPIAEPKESHLESALAAAGFFAERERRVAPELRLSDAAGDEHTLADERGRLVLLNFWGVSCEHCLAGMPKLQRLADEWRSHGLSVLNVCADAESAAMASEMVARVSPGTQVWVDETGLANAQFEVHALPTVWLIDREGHLIGCARGMKDWGGQEMRDLIDYLLKS